MQIATQKHTHKHEKASQTWYVQKITILPPMNLVILEWLKCWERNSASKNRASKGKETKMNGERKGVKTETWTQQHGRESQRETAWKTPARNIEKKILLKSRANQQWWIWLRRINTRGERQDWVGATPRHQIKQRPRTVIQDQETKLADVLNTFWSSVFLLRTDKFIFPIVDWICFINLSEIDISPLWCVAIERAPPACRYREIFLPRVCSLCGCLFTLMTLFFATRAVFTLL